MKSQNRRRINIVLPEATLKVLERVAPKGNRSRLISDAVLHYVTTRAKASLAERLKQGALVNAERDLAMAADWFPVDEEAWQRKPKARKS